MSDDDSAEAADEDESGLARSAIDMIAEGIGTVLLALLDGV